MAIALLGQTLSAAVSYFLLTRTLRLLFPEIIHFLVVSTYLACTNAPFRTRKKVLIGSMITVTYRVSDRGGLEGLHVDIGGVFKR